MTKGGVVEVFNKNLSPSENKILTVLFSENLILSHLCITKFCNYFLLKRI